eukprot:3038821-Pyramimonas_sp.AAC.1
MILTLRTDVTPIRGRSAVRSTWVGERRRRLFSRTTAALDGTDVRGKRDRRGAHGASRVPTADARGSAGGRTQRRARWGSLTTRR